MLSCKIRRDLSTFAAKSGRAVGESLSNITVLGNRFSTRLKAEETFAGPPGCTLTASSPAVRQSSSPADRSVWEIAYTCSIALLPDVNQKRREKRREERRGEERRG
jgi:hypothetical protein